MGRGDRRGRGWRAGEHRRGRLVVGTFRRGGARFGTAVLLGLSALALAVVAWIPVVGYLEAVLVPALAARLRALTSERYAGLRSLAKD